MMKLPEKWADWTMEEEIGFGSYGSVYKCRNLNTDEISAIKVIKIPQDPSDAEALQSTYGARESVQKYYSDFVHELVNEIKTMELLRDCPNVVRIEDSLIEENAEGIGWTIYIRMEYLHRFVDQLFSEENGEQDAIRVGIDILTALEACEQKHVIHRDIKPNNILMTEDSTHKLGDFGMAKQIDNLSGTMSVKGTYSFMSPEVFYGKSYDKRADLYSLGLILYQMMNRNRDPFVSLDKQIVYFKDKEAALHKRMHGEALPLPAKASPEFAKIILKACRYDPAERYSCATEMKKDLVLLSQGKFRVKGKIKDTSHVEVTLQRQGLIRIGVAVVVIAVAILSCVFGINRYRAVTVLNSYDAGDGIEYTVYKDNTLVVSGSGEVSLALGKISWGNVITQNIKKVVIDEGITAIGDEAFCNVTGIREVELASTVTTIDRRAFAKCENLERINLQSVEVIETQAFLGCTSLKELTVSDNLKSAGNFAFSDCDSLHEVELPDSLVVLSEGLLADCDNLEQVVLGNQVTEIGEYMFNSCKKLKRVDVPDGFDQSAIPDSAFRAAGQVKIE